MPGVDIISHSDHMTRTLFKIDKIVLGELVNLIIVALHNYSCFALANYKRPKVKTPV